MSTRVVKHMCDLGNQRNNSSHQDQIFDKPSALSLVGAGKCNVMAQRRDLVTFYGV